MYLLEDITDKLLVRSQEAILQLDIWIQQQRRLGELPDCTTEDHTLYIAQLNSLYIRSKYVRDKMSGKNSKIPTIKNPEEYIEELVYEFKDITIKLNELASTRRINTSPGSQSTRSSKDSFQPRPLKLLSRQDNHLSLDRSPTKVAKPIVTETNFFAIEEFRTLSIYKSLPSSPVKRNYAPMDTSPKRQLRQAVSYSDGLNNPRRRESKTKSRQQAENEYERLFKENNRLSLSLTGDSFNGIDQDFGFDEEAVMDSTLHYDSDADTIRQYNNTLCEPKQFEPLRRYNSHESILSTKNDFLLNKKSQPLRFSPFTPNTYSKPSIGSVQVTSSPIFANTTSSMKNAANTSSTRIRSSDLLNSVMVETATQLEPRGINTITPRLPKKNNSIFNKWNLFNTYSIPVISEVGVNDFNKSLPSLSKRKTIQTFRRHVSEDTVIISTIISSKSKAENNINGSFKDRQKSMCGSLDTDASSPIAHMNKNITFFDLQEALDTELLI